MKMRVPTFKLPKFKLPRPSGELTKSVIKSLHAPSGAEVLFDVLQVAGGLALFFVFAAVSLYLDWYIDLGILVAGALFTYTAPLKFQYRLLLTTAILGSSLFYFLSQPLLTPLGWVAGGLALTVIVDEWKYPSRKVLIGLFVLGTVVSFVLMSLISLVALPYVHPFTVKAAGWLPASFLALCIVFSGLATVRQRAEQDSHDYLVAPVIWILFAVYCGPRTYVGLAVMGLIIVVQFVVSFRSRPTFDKKGRSHSGFKTTIVFSGIGLALMAVSNSVSPLYDLEMAGYKNVTEIKELPVSIVTRMVPMDAAQDYCRSLHHKPNTVIAPEPALIVIDEKGKETMYWQCRRHPDRFLGHELLYVTGGIEGFIVANAGEFGPTGQPVTVDFILGDKSAAIEAAFDIRHPNSEMQRAVIYKAKHGGYHMLITYTTKVMGTGGAILPDAVGVMEVSPLGFIKDLTLAQAADQYPKVPIFPASVSRLYAEAWGRAPSIAAVVRTGEQFMISEAKGGGNKYPFFETFKTGLKGVVAFETVGADQNQLSAFAFTNPASGDMEIYRFPAEKSEDIATRSGESQNPVGPAQIVGRVHLSHPGMFNVHTTEALPIFTEDHRVYWLTAMMQDEKKPDGTTTSSYSRSVLYTGNGNRFWDVRSVGEVIASMKPGLPSQKPSDN